MVLIAGGSIQAHQHGEKCSRGVRTHAAKNPNGSSFHGIIMKKRCGDVNRCLNEKFALAASRKWMHNFVVA
jgi:hypothetical protein